MKRFALIAVTILVTLTLIGALGANITPFKNLIIGGGAGDADGGLSFTETGEIFGATIPTITGDVNVVGSLDLIGLLRIRGINVLMESGGDLIIANGSGITGSVIIRSGSSVTALVIDSSQKATFAGDVGIEGNDITFAGDGVITPGGTKLTIVGDLVWEGDANGLPGGSMYNDDTPTIVTNTGAGNFVRIPSGFTAGQVNETAFGNARELTVTYAGRYRISYSISFTMSGGAGREIEGAIAIDNVKQDPGTSHRTVGTATDTGNMGSEAILDLPASSVIALMVANESDGVNDVVVQHASMVAVMVWGT